MANHTHWMRLNVGDYLADTLHLSAFEHGMYILLILHYFRRGELPDKEALIARIARCPSTYLWRKSGPAVMALFQRIDGRWRHKRIDAELQLAQQVTAIKQQAGRKGAEARYGKQPSADTKNSSSAVHEKFALGIAQVIDIAGARDSNWHRETEPEPKLKQKEEKTPPLTPPPGGACVMFTKFWENYPRRVGRRAAEIAFAAAIKRGNQPEDILDGLRRASFAHDPRYQPHPATW